MSKDKPSEEVPEFHESDHPVTPPPEPETDEVPESYIVYTDPADGKSHRVKVSTYLAKGF